VCVCEEGKLAKLITEPIAVRKNRSLLRVTLLTGRPHQIRVQHMHAGFPLWGDARYGGGKPGEQLALWSHSLTIDHPTRHEEMTFVSTPPMTGAWKDFERELV